MSGSVRHGDIRHDERLSLYASSIIGNGQTKQFPQAGRGHGGGCQRGLGVISAGARVVVGPGQDVDFHIRLRKKILVPLCSRCADQVAHKIVRVIATTSQRRGTVEQPRQGLRAELANAGEPSIQLADRLKPSARWLFLRSPRKLKRACQAGLGTTLSRDYRDTEEMGERRT